MWRFRRLHDGVKEPIFSVVSRFARPDPHARPAGQKGGQLIDIRAAPNIGKLRRDMTDTRHCPTSTFLSCRVTGGSRVLAPQCAAAIERLT